MRLVAFDLDWTLLEGDSGYEWPRFLAEEGSGDPETCETLIRAMVAQDRARTFDMTEYLLLQLAPLSGQSRAQVDAWRVRFVREKIVPIVKPGARALVERHLRDPADLVSIVTGTSRLVTEPIAAELGVSHLIATEAEEADGGYTGRIAGTPCFREGKVTRLVAWLSGRGLAWDDFEETWFYSDSFTDLPLLSRVSHPVAVDPDEDLRRHAAERGWRIISTR